MEPTEIRKQELQELKDQADKLNELATPKTPVLPEKNAWGLSPGAAEAITKGVELYHTKHGLYSSIPMLCKGDACQYASICPLLESANELKGQRCALEISLIISKYEAYKQELKIEEGDAVDLSLLKDLIDYDVQILRAENKMAIEGDFVKDQLFAVSQDGEEIYQEQISQAAVYKDKIQVKRNKTLELLNSTRKDKSGERLARAIDPSSYAMSIIKKAAEAKTSTNTIEADFEELEEVELPEYLRMQKEGESHS